MRAGQSIEFLGFAQSANPSAFAALQRAMLSHDLQLNVCYCSIFDECWKSDLTTLSLTPAPVQACLQLYEFLSTYGHIEWQDMSSKIEYSLNLR